MNQNFSPDPNSPTGPRCELCHTPGSERVILIPFYLDRDPTNVNANNTALVCGPCYRHLALAMPEGIKSSGTLFAFLINRGLYSLPQLSK